MKKLYITLSFVIASGILSAQNKDTKTADKLFDRYEYTEAATEYLKLVEKEKADNYVYKQLADSYYNIFNTKEATKWFQCHSRSTTVSKSVQRRNGDKCNGRWKIFERVFFVQFCQVSPCQTIIGWGF